MSYEPKTMETAHYRPDIDGLRGIAVLSVVAYHAFPNIIRGGFIGVDVFFVISGFLITEIILEAHANNKFSFSNFYSRRIRRIFPALITVLVACIAFGWVNLLPNELSNLGKNIAASAVFLSNILAYQELDYFSSSAEAKPLLHLWSLGIEEQFYLVWPFIVTITYKSKKKLFWVTTITTITSFALSIHYSGQNPSFTFYIPQNRAWELLIGSLIALSPKLGGLSSCFGNHFKSILGATLLLIGLLLINKEREFPGWWALLPTIGTMLLISSGPKALVNNRLLSHPGLVRVGLISYPLYLWHWPILSFLYISYKGSPPFWVRIFALLIALAFAWLTYNFIEKSMRFGEWSTKRTYGLIGALSIVGSLGMLIAIEGGVPSRLNPKYLMLEKQFQRTEFGEHDCEHKMKPYGIPTCQIGDPNQDPTAAIIGDSHAGNFFWGLKDHLNKNNGNLLSLSVGGCPPLLNIKELRNPNIDEIACEWFKPMFSYLLGNSHIDTVYIAFHHREYFRDELRMTFNNGQYAAMTNAEKLKKSLLYTISELQSKGKKVILIYDMPSLDTDIKRCFRMRPLDLSDNTCDPRSLKFKDDFTEYDNLISELQKERGVTVFKTHQYIQDNFPINNKGEPTYYDKDHLSKIGSMFFSDKYNIK